MKNNTLNISIIIGLVVIVIIYAMVIINPFRIYKYELKINTSINYQESLAVNIEQSDGNYKESTSIPTSGYVLNTTESFCGVSNGDGTYTRNESAIINYHDGVVSFDNINERNTQCFLYFDEVKVADLILTDNTVDSSRKSGYFTEVFTEDTAGRIFEGPADDYGNITYFFAGANPNNWVKFAGYYWRIIRVNGNGSIRLIYNGTDTSTTGTTTQISTSIFELWSFDNMYVGYMYTSGEVHGLGTSSTIKEVLDTWYTNNLASYSSFIDTDTGFCGDRQPSTSTTELNGLGGTGTTTTYYAPYIRRNSTHQFTYQCKESSDLYTVSNSSYGNKALTYPIGLITIDEIIYAGGNNNINSSFWLCTNQNYWTMSPSNYELGIDDPRIYVLMINGQSTDFSGNQTLGVRPVINISSSVTLTGTGTSTDPYIVS